MSKKALFTVWMAILFMVTMLAACTSIGTTGMTIASQPSLSSNSNTISINGQVAERKISNNRHPVHGGIVFELFVNGQRLGARYRDIPEMFNFDGKLAYVAEKQNGLFTVVLDGIEGHEYNRMWGDLYNVKGELTYLVSKGTKENLVFIHGTKEIPTQGGGVCPLFVSNKFIFKTGGQGKEFVKIGEGERGPYKRIIGCPMELNTKLLVNAILLDDSFKFLVIDPTEPIGVEEARNSRPLDELIVQKAEHEFYTEVTVPIESDGKIIYGARQGDTWILVAKT